MSSESRRARASRRTVSLPLWQRGLLLAAGYFLLAHASAYLSPRNGSFVTFWLPAGLYVAVLLLTETRSWPWLVLAAAAGNLAFDLPHGTPAPVALFFSLANAGGAVSGAWLVRRFVAERPRLRALGEFVGFLVLAGLLGAAVAATIGAGTLVLFGMSDAFAASWFVWWGSVASAVLILSPFVLTACSMTSADYRRFHEPWMVIEATLLVLVTLAVAAYLLFWSRGIMSPNKGWLVYAVVWAGLRFGPLGASAATLLVSVTMTFFSTQFFSGLTAGEVASGSYIPVMQEGIGALAFLAWIPAIVIGERDRRMQELSDSERRLKLANQASNIGTWDWNVAEGSAYYSPESRAQLGLADPGFPAGTTGWHELLHPEDRERTLAALRSSLADPHADFAAEFRLRHVNGSYRWIYARGEIMRDADGRPVRLLGCHIDVTERRRVEEELRRSLARLQELSRRLVEVEGEERRHISRELHDSVGQNLAALNLNLQVIRGQLPENTLRAVESRLNDTQRLIEATSRHVRDVMAELRPAALDDYGLVAALRTYAVDYAKRCGVEVSVEGDDPEPRLPTAVETELFRIAQEALNNTAKHARAGKVEISVGASAERVRLTIADNGVGFDASEAAWPARSWGMSTMRERADSVGARLRVESAPGDGTRVSVEVERVERAPA